MKLDWDTECCSLLLKRVKNLFALISALCEVQAVTDPSSRALSCGTAGSPVQSASSEDMLRVMDTSKTVMTTRSDTINVWKMPEKQRSFFSLSTLLKDVLKFQRSKSYKIHFGT